MTGLDCNILVQLALADHPANFRTEARRLLTSNPADFAVFGVLETVTP
jgi:hypothetical protein